MIADWSDMSYSTLVRRHISLCQAVKQLYYSAHWYPDRRVDADKLWRTVRDAAGLPEGKSSSVLGPSRVGNLARDDETIARLRHALVLARKDLRNALAEINRELEST